MVDQLIVIGTLVLALILFIQNKYRYDLVALFSLVIVVLAGVVKPDEAFSGFGHPAVITVAAVLILSRGLSDAGVVSILVSWVSRVGKSELHQLIALTALVTVISSFMNNIGALALIMPVAIRMARENHQSPSIFLMPLAFGSLLGGLTTLIGTPPNIIIATFRQEHASMPFKMFDFFPVGIGVACIGFLFMITLGRRLIPRRSGSASREELFQIDAYTTEVRVTDKCSMVGHTVSELHNASDVDIVIIGLAHGDRLRFPSSHDLVEPGDILIVEADSQELKKFIDTANVELVGSKELCKNFYHMTSTASEETEEPPVCEEPIGPSEMGLFEAVITLGSPIVNRTVVDVGLRQKYGINLLAVSRQGTRLSRRLKRIHFQAGDVLLLQGPDESVRESLPKLGCFPLAERDYQLGRPRKVTQSLILFGLAVILITFNILPIQIAFVIAALSFIITGIISLRVAYESIDFPILVLLATMIPVGHALETTGAANTIASYLSVVSGQLPLFAILTLLMVVSIGLSNVINNAATAVIMAPIGIGLAQNMGMSIDPFLMTIAVGSSTPFLTPIGHQSNTLVMGPAGYTFSDYWKLGLPLTFLVATVSIPIILAVWK